MEKKSKLAIEFEIDTKPLDVAIEKAKRLLELLREVQQPIVPLLENEKLES